MTIFLPSQPPSLKTLNNALLDPQRQQVNECSVALFPYSPHLNKLPQPNMDESHPHKRNLSCNLMEIYEMSIDGTCDI
jgi:hypothetical protein